MVTKNNIQLLLRLLQISVVFVSLQIILINHLISVEVHPNFVLRSSLSSLWKDDPSATTTTATRQTKQKDGIIEDQGVLDIARNMLSNAGAELNESEEKSLVEALNDSNYFKVYGKEPIILGKENCQVYREKVPAEERLVAPMGTFNTVCVSVCMFLFVLTKCVLQSIISCHSTWINLVPYVGNEFIIRKSGLELCHSRTTTKTWKRKSWVRHPLFVYLFV